MCPSPRPGTLRRQARLYVPIAAACLALLCGTDAVLLDICNRLNSDPSVTKVYCRLTRFGWEEVSMDDALYTLAMWLRDHKLADWDWRKFRTDWSDEKPEAAPNREFMERFPNPPLVTLDANLRAACEFNIYECVRVAYGQAIQHWLFMQVNWIQTSRDVFTEDYIRRYVEDAYIPFQTGLELFNYRTAVAYYMCWYTMREQPELRQFRVQDCADLQPEITRYPEFRYTSDYRAKSPDAFSCARFSFCPDACCGALRRELATRADCTLSELNPCRRMQLEKKCDVNAEQNRDFYAMIANRWNYTCYCDKRGEVWSVEYNGCVDRDECYTQRHDCDERLEMCRNTVGSYYCLCKWGYRFEPRTGRCRFDEAFRSNRIVLPDETVSTQTPPDVVDDLASVFNLSPESKRRFRTVHDRLPAALRNFLFGTNGAGWANFGCCYNVHVFLIGLILLVLNAER